MAKVRERVATVFEAFRSTRVATWQPLDQVTHIYQLSNTPTPEVSCPGNPPAQGWTLQAAVAGIAKPSDRDLTPIDTFKNRLGADIVGAITTGAAWYNWDGLAINTMLSDIEEYVGDDAAAHGVIVKMNIIYRTDENDLYTVRA